MPGAMPKEPREQPYPEAVPVIHKGQIFVARQRRIDKFPYNEGLRLRGLCGVTEQLLRGQQQVGVRVLCLRNECLHY